MATAWQFKDKFVILISNQLGNSEQRASLWYVPLQNPVHFVCSPVLRKPRMMNKDQRHICTVSVSV